MKITCSTVFGHGRHFANLAYELQFENGQNIQFDLLQTILGVILNDNLTPKQIAAALRVSESSVKRWCDRGDIRTDRTLGGHRRVPLGFLLEFLETTNRRILDPLAIGLEPCGRSIVRNSISELDSEATIARFEKSLLLGSETECRKIISSWYSTQGGMCSLADDLLSPTFCSIGKLWREGTIDIYQERLACEICHRIVFELKWLLAEPSATAPLAMGGTPSGDQYQLATLLTEMVFREQGWRTAGLGSNIPFPSLLSAARKHMPKIFWISVSHIEDEKTFLESYADFTKRLPKGIVLVVGGRALTDELRPKMMYSAHCDGMRQLTTLARALKTGSLPLAP